MAVIAEISHCQHKYTAWTIQPFTAGKSRTVDDSQSAFCVLLQPPFSFNYSISLASSSSLQFVWHFSPWFLHHTDKGKAHPQVLCLISPSATGLAIPSCMGPEQGWNTPFLWRTQSKAEVASWALCWFFSFSLHVHSQETFPSHVNVFVNIFDIKYLKYLKLLPAPHTSTFWDWHWFFLSEIFS